MKAIYSILTMCLFSITATFAQKKLELTCQSPSGETVKYQLESFSYNIFNRDSATATVQFYIILKQKPDKFILQWRAKPQNTIDGILKVQNTVTRKTEQTFDFKSGTLISMSNTLESDRISLSVEAQKLTLDGIEIELNQKY